MKIIRLIFFGLVLSFLPLLSAKEGKPRIVIFHTNDIHGMIDTFPRIAHLADQERKQSRDVFFLNAGDAFTGNPIVDQYSPPGQPIIDLFQAIGLTASTLGNHEFDYGQKVLAGYMAASRFPFLCANVDTAAGTIPAPLSHVTLTTKGGTRLIVAGLLQISGPGKIPDTHPDHVAGLKFREPFAVARSLARLKRRGDILVFLTHLGFDQDVRLAKAVPGIDLIVGGHSHTVVSEPRQWNGTLIVQTGAKGRFLGRIDLEIKGKRVTRKTGRLIDLEQIHEEKAEIKAMVSRFNDNPRLNRVLCTAPVALEGYDELGCLFGDAVRSELDLDVVFLNQGGIRVSRLPESIRLLDVYRLDPFANDVVEFRLAPREIRSLIRDSIERTGGIDLQVSGLSYRVRMTEKNRVEAIDLLDLIGQQWPEDQSLRVGLNSYIASSYRFDHADPGRSLQTRTSDCLIRFLEKHPDLSRYKGIRRIQINSRDNDASGDFRQGGTGGSGRAVAD